MSDITMKSLPPGAMSGGDTTRSIRVVPKDRPLISPVPLLMMGGLVLSALAMATYGSLTGMGLPKMTASPLVESRELAFQAVGEEGYTARDPATGKIVAELRLAKGDGFVMQVIRGLNHDRKVAGTEAAAPYRLTRHADGRSYMIDPSTGKFIATASFGPAQAAHVSNLIDKAVKVAGERP
ncbi:MAG: photosynthetic complex assembly protein PuhC [Beijerinckiaceae bacterium]